MPIAPVPVPVFVEDDSEDGSDDGSEGELSVEDEEVSEFDGSTGSTVDDVDSEDIAAVVVSMLVVRSMMLV